MSCRSLDQRPCDDVRRRLEAEPVDALQDHGPAVAIDDLRAGRGQRRLDGARSGAVARWNRRVVRIAGRGRRIRRIVGRRRVSGMRRVDRAIGGRRARASSARTGSRGCRIASASRRVPSTRRARARRSRCDSRGAVAAIRRSGRTVVRPPHPHRVLAPRVDEHEARASVRGPARARRPAGERRRTPFGGREDEARGPPHAHADAPETVRHVDRACRVACSRAVPSGELARRRCRLPASTGAPERPASSGRCSRASRRRLHRPAMYTATPVRGPTAVLAT